MALTLFALVLVAVASAEDENPFVQDGVIGYSWSQAVAESSEQLVQEVFLIPDRQVAQVNVSANNADNYFFASTVYEFEFGFAVTYLNSPESACYYYDIDTLTYADLESQAAAFDGGSNNSPYPVSDLIKGDYVDLYETDDFYNEYSDIALLCARKTLYEPYENPSGGSGGLYYVIFDKEIHIVEE